MIKFTPIYQARLWGGRRISTALGRALPAEMNDCGESWELSDRPEAMSIVSHGPWKGFSLHELWEKHRAELFGPGYGHFERFPILAKILSPEKVLSVQIHPDAEAARILGGEEKNECWYFADVDGAVDLYVGLSGGISVEDSLRALREGSISRHLRKFEARAGDSIFIPALTVHALGAPCLVYEIQQNADTTYRLDDWGRVDGSGAPRRLHLEQSAVCMQRRAPHTRLRPSGSGSLADTRWFRLEEIALRGNELIPVADKERFCVVTVISGSVEDAEEEARTGDFFILPAGGEAPRVTSNGARLLLTTVPPSAPCA